MFKTQKLLDISLIQI